MAEALERLLRDGRRSVVLDMSGVSYLSSPGTQALQQAYQDYVAARGELRVVSPSSEAADALTQADLLPKLLAQPSAAADAVSGPAADHTRDDWRVPTALAARGTYEVSTRDPGAELYCRVHGRAEAAVRSWIDSTDYRAFEFPETAFGLGIGALGADRAQAGSTARRDRRGRGRRRPPADRGRPGAGLRRRTRRARSRRPSSSPGSSAAEASHSSSASPALRRSSRSRCRSSRARAWKG